MAKKKPKKTKANSKKNPYIKNVKRMVPAIYPEPEPIELLPQEIIGYDPETNTIILKGSMPRVIKDAEERERLRLDLNQRLKKYALVLGSRVARFISNYPYGKTPKAAEKKLRSTRAKDLSIDATVEAHQALYSIHTMYRMVDELIAAGDYPDSIDRAICWAIDLGKLLERGQTQIDHGEAVDRGRKNMDAHAAAVAGATAKKQSRSEAARQEFEKRLPLNPNRTPTDILNAMAEEEYENGKPRWGSIASLNRWKKEWGTIKPPK